jgi:calcineurin-like phosphoesterase family protein
MPAEPIRWLHLSDFHMGKEGSRYAQLSMIEYILGEVEKRVKGGHNLDLIFITGDLANNGHRQQYEDFYDIFYLPLFEKLGKNWQGKIFTVPGNHDVNWDEAKAVKKHGVLNVLPNFLDPDSEGLKLRQPLFPRFLAYTDHDFGSQQKSWIALEAGTYTEELDIRDISIGIVGLNTGWLSENNEKNEKNKDLRELTPGYNLLREAIKKIKEKQLRIVLGHHPLNWFRDEDERAIKALLANNRAIYLHGHLHQAEELFEYGAGKNFLSLCTGAAFKVRPEDQIKKNGILFCDYFPEKALYSG